MGLSPMCLAQIWRASGRLMGTPKNSAFVAAPIEARWNACRTRSEPRLNGRGYEHVLRYEAIIRSPLTSRGMASRPMFERSLRPWRRGTACPALPFHAPARRKNATVGWRAPFPSRFSRSHPSGASSSSPGSSNTTMASGFGPSATASRAKSGGALSVMIS